MTESVTQWLEGLGLGQFAKLFAEQLIDYEVLVELTESDLEKLGIPLGARKKLLKAAAVLGEAELSPVPADALGLNTDERLAAWERHPGERKPVTMLFADITGSTELTEKLDAEETHDLLYGATQRMCAAIENNRGTVCRFMGDGVMAMFGAPMASEQHAIDACEAALDMQRAIRDYATDGNGLQIRVGLHSGEVVVLTVGEGDKVEFDASGPTVPIAARMEQSAQPGEVYLTSATRSLAANRIETEALDPLSVKGISEPVPLFALRRVRSIEEEVPDTAQTPFVGRRAELNQFKGMLDTCIAEGHGQTIYLRGEPGIGKTRLVEEFTTIAAGKGASTHRCLILSFGVGKGQDAIRSLVRSVLGIAPGCGKDDRLLAAQTALVDGRLDSGQAVFLNDLLDLPQTIEQKSLYDAMDNVTRNEGKRAVVSALVTATSNTQPTVVIVEDVHWADTLTLAHLSALTQTAANCPALLVMTSRIEGDQLDQSWRSTTDGSPFVSIDLGPLRKQDSIALIGEFIDTGDALAASCLERAAGNPLFLEQLLRNAKEGATESLPDSIQSLVLARIDRLPAADKKALQAASVLGQRFDEEILWSLLNERKYDCDELVSHNLIRPEGNGYLFAHALIQESVYGSLVKSMRTDFHRRASRWYEERDLVLHAKHLARAGDPAASSAYLRAVRQERSLYRYVQAQHLVDEGIRYAAPSDLFELTCLRGELLQDIAFTEESISSFERAFEIASNDIERCRAQLGIAAGLRMLDEPSKALPVLNHAEATAKTHGLTLRLAEIHHLKGNLYWNLDRHDECRQNHELALKYAVNARSPELEALALGGLGDAYIGAGRVKTAHDYFTRCIDVCRKHGFGRVEVAHRSMVADALTYLGDNKGALSESLAAARMAAQVGHIRAENLARQSACMIAAELGDSALAREQLELSKALTSKHELPRQEKYNVIYEGIVLASEGHVEEALEVLEKAASTLFAFAPAIDLMTDEVELRATIKKGEAIVRQRPSCYDCLAFYPAAIDASLRLCDWDEAERYANVLKEYTSEESIPVADFYIARANVLVTIGRGQWNETSPIALRHLRDEAQRMGLVRAIPALDAALSLT